MAGAACHMKNASTWLPACAQTAGGTGIENSKITKTILDEVSLGDGIGNNRDTVRRSHPYRDLFEYEDIESWMGYYLEVLGGR